jgi:prepilin-type processing-associated H-X9-DG protein
MTQPLHRSAYTLIEVLVVMCILTVLIGLLLPAVMKVRSAALRATCYNNLRQFGIALLSYEATCGSFPPGLVVKPEEDDLQNGTATGFHFLLPHLDQEGLYRQWQHSVPWSAGANQKIATASLRVLICPANGLGGNVDLEGLGGYLDEDLPSPGATDYVFCKGPNANLCPFSTLTRSVRGPFDVNSATRLVEIVDGTSNTFALGEGAGGHAQFTARATWNSTTPLFDANANPVHLDQGWSMGMVVNGETAGDGYYFGSVLAVTAQRGGFNPPMDEPLNNSMVMAAVDYNRSTDNSDPTIGAFDTLPGFRSVHGGCNFSFCDGSVRFFTTGVSGSVYRGLSTIAGRELVGNY